MVPAIDPRRLVHAASFVLVCWLVSALLTTMAVAQERAASREMGEPREVDSSIWFAALVAEQAALNDDETLPQIRPLFEPEDERDAPALPRPTFDPTPIDERPLDESPLDERIFDDARSPSRPGRGSTGDSAFTLFRQSRSRTSFARQRRPIAVLGDSLVDEGQLELRYSVFDYHSWPNSSGVATASTDIPLIAAATRRRVSANSSVIPTDRVMFNYQHFRNGLSVQTSHPGAGDSRHVLDLDRATAGFEKTFFAGRWSLDARLPVMSRFDVTARDFALTNGRLGNVSLLLKHLWYETDGLALGFGLGLDAPTGSDGLIKLPRSEVLIANDSYHALPYVGLLFAPTDTTVIQAFAQVDFPLNSNKIEIRTPSIGSIFGSFAEQELLFLSLSGARWLYQNPDATHLRGVAAMFELHYTTSLEDSPRVRIASGGDTYELSNPFNIINILNMTAGMQAQIGMTDFRVAGVVPMLSGSGRPFDAEVMVQVNRRY